MWEITVSYVETVLRKFIMKMTRLMALPLILGLSMLTIACGGPEAGDEGIDEGVGEEDVMEDEGVEEPEEAEEEPAESE